MSAQPDKLISTKTYLPPKMNIESLNLPYQPLPPQPVISNQQFSTNDTIAIPPFINRAQNVSVQYGYPNILVPTQMVPQPSFISYIPPNPVQYPKIIHIQNREPPVTPINPMPPPINQIPPIVTEKQNASIPAPKKSKSSSQKESDSFEYESSDSDNEHKKKNQLDWDDDEDRNNLKERNRAAAKKWRQKKDKYLNQLENENDVLRQQALSLLKQVRSLHSENQLLEEEILFFQAFMTQIMHVSK